MRLHRLAVSAFGPFAGPVEIDLEELSDAGLFLIHGPTGSGKTSLLDAICYALYGTVPGTRDKGSLHSHHAAPGVVPGVELDLTVGGRRLRVERHPAFERPKKSGTGTTLQRSSAHLHEHVDGDWVSVSGRESEIGQVLSDILGMDAEQFWRVALLPQGDFAAFLHQGDDDRRRLLQRLFPVGEYTDLQGWLAERKDEASRRLRSSEEHLHHLGDELVRLASGVPDEVAQGAGEEGDEEPPEGMGADADLGMGADADLVAAAADLEARLQALVTDAGVRLDEAEVALMAAGQAREEGRRVASLRQRGEAAAARLAELDSRAEGRALDRQRLEAAMRAAGPAERLAALDEAAARARLARAELDRLAPELGQLGLSPTDPGRVRAARELAEEHDDETAATDALAGALTRLRGQLERADGTLEVAEQELAGSVERQRHVAERIEPLREVAARLPELSDRRVTAQQDARAADEALAAAHRLEQLAHLADEADELRRAAVDHAQAAVDRTQALRQERLEGMAGELAEGLTDGEPCLVCGSAEHPAPATRGARVGAEDVAAAEHEESVAVAARLEAESRHAARAAAVDGALADLAARASLLEVAVDADGLPTVAALTDCLDDRRSLLDQAEQDRADAAAARDALDALRAEERAAAAAATAAGESAARAAAHADALREQVRDAEDAVRAAIERHASCPCGGSGSGEGPGGGTEAEDRPPHDAGTDPSGTGSPLTERWELLSEHHRRAVDLLGSAVARCDVDDTAQADLARARSAATASVEEAGFGGAEEVRAAALPKPEREALDALLRDEDAALAHARSVLAEPDVDEAMDAPAPDLAALVETEAEARRVQRERASRHTTLHGDHARAGDLRERIAEAVTTLGTDREEARTVIDLAALVAGNGPDNAKRMSLASYVLAARLERVVELANERLAAMGGSRYELAHTDQRPDRRARGGLGLKVIDLWTGQPRPAATLSGGETFVVSLALALALADAVREQSGGVDLGTLFIDEGFGSLDDQALEEVMDVLDTLREGGRAVGVVSHVTEMRTRIPAQIEVRKSRTGSTVAVTAAAALA